MALPCECNAIAFPLKVLNFLVPTISLVTTTIGANGPVDPLLPI